jgi:hypothetical protein
MIRNERYPIALVSAFSRLKPEDRLEAARSFGENAPIIATSFLSRLQAPSPSRPLMPGLLLSAIASLLGAVAVFLDFILNLIGIAWGFKTDFNPTGSMLFFLVL